MSIDYEKFIRSDYNTLLNNVNDSPVSRIYSKILPYTNNISESIQLYDGKYGDPVYVRPRYEGAKSTSAIYSFYTVGDNSYGKNPAIDWNCYKFAWSNNINEYNLNFVDKCLINIRYLIDPTGSVLELTSRNDNLFEVQNMYKKADMVHISLLDKYNPTDQSSVEGDKPIFEGGYRFVPILYRERNETMSFLFTRPSGFASSGSRFGVKVVNKPSQVFRTIGNADTDLASTPSSNTIVEFAGVSQANPYSKNKLSSLAWPYTQIPLNTNGPYKNYTGQIFYDSDPKIESNSNFYTLDYFLPSDSGSSAGGYITENPGNLRVENTGTSYYTYYEADRSSIYTINLNIPLRISFSTNPDAGWSTFKVIAVIEKQVAGSTNWTYEAHSKLRIIKLPKDIDFSVDERNSAILIDLSNTAADPYAELYCELLDQKVSLDQGDKIRLRFYFAEMRNVFRRTETFYFGILSGNSYNSYFEIYDTSVSSYQFFQTGSVPGSTLLDPTFKRNSDGRSIVFNTTMSVLYNAQTRFLPPDPLPPQAISRYYSPVEDLFRIQRGDLVRFSSYYTYDSTLYEVSDVAEPIIANDGSVQSPLIVYFNTQVPSDLINGRTIAILRKKEDETSIIINFVKNPGQSSNAIIIPYNLQPEIRNQIGNIITPLKETILSKVLLIS